MTSPELTKVIASVFALAGFAVALVSGLAVQNSPLRVLGTAVAALFACHLMGVAVGAVGERIVNEHLDRVRAAEPIPEGRSKGVSAAATTPAVRATH